MLYSGIDIEDVDRIKRLLDIKPLLLQNIFSKYEWEYALQKNTAQTLAGIWCAKEAVVKAFSCLVILDIRGIEIEHYANGAPYLKEVENYEISPSLNVVLSISHTKKFAVASCIILSI